MLPVASRQVVYKAVADGAVLLHTQTEVYYGLNRVGARVWELLPPVSSTLDELCEALQRSYPDATLEELRQDVTELFDELISYGLLEVAS